MRLLLETRVRNPAHDSHLPPLYTPPLSPTLALRSPQWKFSSTWHTTPKRARSTRTPETKKNNEPADRPRALCDRDACIEPLPLSSECRLLVPLVRTRFPACERARTKASPRLQLLVRGVSFASKPQPLGGHFRLPVPGKRICLPYSRIGKDELSGDWRRKVISPITRCTSLHVHSQLKPRILYTFLHCFVSMIF